MPLMAVDRHFGYRAARCIVSGIAPAGAVSVMDWMMSDPRRQALIDSARTVVIKVGTSVLSNDDDSLDVARIASLCEQIHRIRRTNRRVVVVTSGAVGAGMGLLGLRERPKDLPHLQAAAAVGQAHLMRLYNDCLQAHSCRAAQLLLTGNDFRSRERYLNVRNTLQTLFEYPVIPIINENDTVSISEIQFGDNDQLASMVNNLLDDTLLVILSVIDGLYDGAPGAPGSKVIPLVENWDGVPGLATDDRSRRGTGGMHTKLKAVRRVTEVGESVIIANGRDSQILDRILAGEEVGTLFVGERTRLPAWKRWLGYTMQPRASLRVDAGARKALVEKGSSLLPIGVTAVEGDFDVWALVSLIDPDGHEFARGLASCDSRTVQSIRGRRSADIEAQLGSLAPEEVIHRDNLVVF